MKKALRSVGRFVLDTLETIVLALAMFAIGYLFVLQPHQVNGDSMLPDFVDQEHLLTEKVIYRLRDPHRGEVIVFKYPKAHEYDYIKRIIGLPGETVLIEGGRVKIFNSEHPSGFFLEEPYLEPGTQTIGRPFIPTGKKFAIPEDHYVVLGDNRTKSSDSREWGTVRRDEVIGRAWVRYWPPRALALIPTARYEE